MVGLALKLGPATGVEVLVAVGLGSVVGVAVAVAVGLGSVVAVAVAVAVGVTSVVAVGVGVWSFSFFGSAKARAGVKIKRVMAKRAIAAFLVLATFLLSFRRCQMYSDRSIQED